MYVERGTPGKKQFASVGSAVFRLARFSCRFANASGRYGISPPSTTPCPGGIPSSPLWSSIFQAAEFKTCQIPFRFSLPPCAVASTAMIRCVENFIRLPETGVMILAENQAIKQLILTGRGDRLD